MDLMKSIYQRNWCALFLLLIIVACTENEVPVPERRTISWQVESDMATQSRVLVNNNVLQTTCTPKADGTNETVGVWGDYTVNSYGQDVIVQEFIATPLTYTSSSGGNSTWEYPGEEKLWMPMSVYNFRACYPQDLMTDLMTQMDATMFQGGPINTSSLQEDILVAAKQVDTRTANLSEAVRLDMQHIFAAIKFKVKPVDGFVPANSEGVTSCWLQNTNNATDLFSPSGYLVHSGNATPVITWHTYESSTAPMYKWEHDGVSFQFENTLYTSNGGKAGNEYTHNDGWILIVPQTVKEGTLTFNYTLKNAGSQVFTVNIPAITYEHGKQYTYMLEIRGSEATIKLSIKPWNHLESSYDITI